jgi:membrane associated rhomboid family serine protease
MINLPPVTTALLVANVAVHVARLLLSPDLDDALVELFGLVPARYTEAGGWSWLDLVDPVTYQFLHGSVMHLAMNMLALLAFGAGIERRLGGARMLVFFLVCGIAGAAAHILVYPSSTDPVIGASGAISGLFGGILVLQRRMGMGGGGRLWLVVAIWIAVIVVTGQAGIPGQQGMLIAWVAHLGGFVAGLLLAGPLDRGRRKPVAAAPPL